MSERVEWALRLYSKSALKQRKFEMLSKYIPSVSNDAVYLDIGSDNGVISYLLRRKGGVWHSADLLADTVESIRGLVSDRVVQIDGQSTPFEDNLFDCVVIVDFLEHIETDGEFVAELGRILKPDGVLVVNVPDPKEGLWRKIRFALGQTDVAHGHVRAGYSAEALAELLSPHFVIEEQETYSRIFAEIIDTSITAALDFLKRGGRGQKGTVVTKDDLGKLEKSFKFYSLLYPVMLPLVWLDKRCFFLRGNMRIARCRAQNQQT